MEKCEFEYLGPYHIQGIVGRGGMGTVYKGVHSKSGDPVAIKVIAPGVANQMRFRRRFAAEVETLKRLRHPNIVQLIGYGEEQGLLFYCMEFVNGHSLHDHLRQFKKLDWTEVIQVGVEMTAALKHAHDLGIIHRDIKPANLMLTADGHVKLTDFGIAKLFGSTEMTAVGSVIGTADFMPPEQAEGKAVTVRSDLYSLGSVLFALLAGRAPFAGKSVPEVLYAVRYSLPPKSHTFAPEAPGALHELISEMLEKDPLKRPPTALVIGNRLKAIQQGLIKLDAERLRSSPSLDPSQTPPEIAKELTSIDLNDESDHDLRVTGQFGTREQPTAIASESLYQRSLSGVDVNNQEPDVYAGSALSAQYVQTSGVQNQGDLPSTDQPLPSGVSHFTPVSPADSKIFTLSTERKEHEPGIDWLQYASIAGMVAALLVAISFGYWMIQPNSADTLYADISSSIESGDESAIIDSLDTLQEFVARFPEDARVAEVRSWLDEADLSRTVRGLQRRSVSRGVEQLSAIEQAFLVCMRARNQDRRTAGEKLNAFLTVYAPLQDLSAKDRRYVELAAFSAKRLAETNTSTALPAVVELEQLIRSSEATMSQSQLENFYRNLLELYGDQPWAQEQLNRIRSKQ